MRVQLGKVQIGSKVLFLTLLVFITAVGVFMIWRGHRQLRREKHVSQQSSSSSVTNTAKQDAEEKSAAEAELELALEDDQLLTQKELEKKSFNKLLDETRKDLPTRADLKAYINKVHELKGAAGNLDEDTPALIVETAARIGQLKASIEHDSELAPNAGSFYLECAKDSEVLASIRALCLSNLMSLAESKIPVDMQGVSAIPKDIVELSARIKEENTERF